MGNIDNTDLNELLKEPRGSVESRSVIYNTPSGRFELNPNSIVPDRKPTIFVRLKLQWGKLFK